MKNQPSWIYVVFCPNTLNNYVSQCVSPPNHVVEEQNKPE